MSFRMNGAFTGETTHGGFTITNVSTGAYYSLHGSGYYDFGNGDYTIVPYTDDGYTWNFNSIPPIISTRSSSSSALTSYDKKWDSENITTPYEFSGASQTSTRRYAYGEIIAQPEPFGLEYELTNCTIDPQPESIDRGSAQTFTITPNDGYELTDENIWADLKLNGLFTGTTVNLTNNGDGTYTLASEYTSSEYFDAASIHAYAEATTQISVEPTYNLTNCSVSPQPTSVTNNSTITLNFNANSGYVFNVAPTMVYIDSSGASHTVTASGSGSSYSLQETMSLGSDSTITITASADAVEITPTYNLTNCTVTPNPATIKNNDTYSFIFTPTDGYEINTPPTISYVDANSSSIETSATKNDDDTYTANVTFENLGANSTITITGIGGEVTSYPITYNLTECTVSPQPETIYAGNSLTLNFSPNDGYYFRDQPVLTYQTTQGDTVTVNATNNVITTTISEDISGTITITANAVIQPDSLYYGTAHIYKITGQTLIDIETYNRSFTTETIPNLSDNIASVRVFYCPIQSGDTVNINLGVYKTSVTAPEISNEMVEIDCGSITIEGQYKNALDYAAEIEFWLPFVGTVPVETNRVMDKTISLKYRVNVLDGSCIAILYDGDTPIAYGTGNISYSLPYGTNSNWQISSQLNIDPDYLIDLTPNVVIRNEIALNSININDNHKVIIGEQTGYCEFTDFILNGFSATQTELEQLDNLLKTGIII